jgi:hypothetical protein
MPRLRRALPVLLASFLVASSASPLRAADEAEAKPPSAEAARETVIKAMTALFTDNADDFESTLDPEDPVSRYNARFFLEYARAKHTFRLVAMAKFGPSEGAGLVPDPTNAKDFQTLLPLLKKGTVWIDDLYKNAILVVEVSGKSSEFHLDRTEDDDWAFDPASLLPEDHAKSFPITSRMEYNAMILEDLSKEIAEGKLTTAGDVASAWSKRQWMPVEIPPRPQKVEAAKAPAAVAGEKSVSCKDPRAALTTFFNAIRTNDSAAAREALASPDSDEGHALEALFLRCVSARAIRGAAFDAFGEVALPLDPFNLADDEFLTPTINAVSWKPLYVRPGMARLSVSLGTLPLTFYFVKSGDDWKIDPAPTIKACAIDPMPEATISVMRVKAKADFDFAEKIKKKEFATWRDARNARRGQQ